MSKSKLYSINRGVQLPSEKHLLQSSFKSTVSELLNRPERPIYLGVSRSPFPDTVYETYPRPSPLPVYTGLGLTEVATAVGSVVELAAFNPIVGGVAATVFGAKLIYDGYQYWKERI